MHTQTTQKPHASVRMLTMTAVLAAFILAFLEFPVPLCPSFARMDLSDLPALIGAFVFGPWIGGMIELIKNALQLTTSATGGIGELANFLILHRRLHLLLPLFEGFMPLDQLIAAFSTMSCCSTPCPLT